MSFLDGVLVILGERLAIYELRCLTLCCDDVEDVAVYVLAVFEHTYSLTE